ILFLDDISKTPSIPEKSNASKVPTTGNDSPVANVESGIDATSSQVHAVIAEEILQTDKYTYIRAKEDNKELWIAVSKMEATVGSTYYFKGGLAMTNF